VSHEEIIVDTEWYKFLVREGELESVLVVANPKIREATEEDLKSIQVFLEDLGRWEKLVSSAAALLRALGSDIEGGTINYPHGGERYEIALKIESPRGVGKVIVGIIRLKDEESKRRAHMRSCFLPAKEIASQIENIPKWLSWKNGFVAAMH
jgi:hypothetical protein